MFGFLVGTLCLLGLVRVIRGPRWGWYGHRWHHHHHGWHHHGWHHHGGHRGGWGRGPLYWLFERLDATPGQEKVILQAVEEMRAHMAKARATMRDQRGAFADAFRGEVLTEEQASALFNPFAQHFDDLRGAMARALGRIHDALDERQRKILADLLQGGGWAWGGGRRGGCGRGHHHGHHHDTDPVSV